MSDLLGLVVADDLTGAADTGHEFAARGYPTLVTLGDESRGEDDPRAAVRVVDTDTRYAPSAAARAAVGRAVARAVDGGSDPLVYKKVDSTLRGNVVAEVEAASTAADADLALVAPAFPAEGRRTVDGRHLVDGDPVSESAAGRDPDAPAGCSHLPTLFAAADHPVVHLPVERVSAGPDAVAAFLDRASTGEADEVATGEVDEVATGEADEVATGEADEVMTAGEIASAPTLPPVVVCDAGDDEHLAALAGGAAATGRRVLYVGSAGLARHVRLAAAAGTEDATDERREGRPGRTADRRPVLAVVGSTAPETLAQVDALPAERVVALDLDDAVEAPETAAREAAARCVDLVVGDDPTAAGEWATVTAARDDRDPDRALAAGRERGIDERTVRRRIATALAGTAAAVLSRVASEPASAGRLRSPAPRSPASVGLFLTGGAVARAVLTRLGAGGVLLRGEAVADGIPLGRVVGGDADGATVVTKAGGFGGRDAIATCLERLEVGA